MSNVAWLTEPYHVYLAARDIDVTIPAGSEFDVMAKVRTNYFGLYQHSLYGEICIDTQHATETPPHE
jgi:hypothetical protein